MLKPLSALLLFLILGLTSAELAAQVVQDLPEGAPVVLAGRISSPPKGILDSKKMQVAVGPRRRDYTVHFEDAELAGPHGRAIDEDGLDDGQWVRVEGTVMRDRRRIRAARVRVVSEDDLGFRRSAFALPGYGAGYLLGTADAARLFPTPAPPPAPPVRPIIIVGRVTDGTGVLELTRSIQVYSAANVWTLEVGGKAAVLNAKDEPVSIHEIAEGQWVRAFGRQTDDLRVQVDRLENLGPENDYRKSVIFRADRPIGYVEFP